MSTHDSLYNIPARMPDFRSITVVCVTGLQDARGAAVSVALCSRQMPGAATLLMSPEVPEGMSPTIRHRVIAPLNYHEYSWFILFALWRFIETDYVLIVQDDGWILDIANWRDEFFDYDYIGAPIHLGRVDTPQGIMWMRRFAWCEHLGKPDSIVMPVLNGGFSLRSRRMLRALVDHPQVRVEVPPPGVIETAPIRMSWFNDAVNEDVQLTAALRPQLEQLGFRYAPLDVCTRFAYEDAGPFHAGVNAKQIFGLHGWCRRLISADPPVVRYGLSRERVAEISCEEQIVELLKWRGYSVEFPPHPGQ
jgi:hypothetical protein